MSKPARKLKTPEPITLQPGIVTDLPLDLIDLDPNQPRKDVDEAYIEALSADIAQSGVKQPITVRASDPLGRYVIKYGECRYRASLRAQKATIPALLDTEADNADPLARLLDQVKENHLRKDLNPMEWAGVLRRMRDDHKIRSIADIEATLKDHGIVNMGRSYISNIMRLAELPEWAQSLIRAGRLTAAHGKYLLPAVASEKVIENIRARIVDDGEEPSVRELQVDILHAFRIYHTNIDGWPCLFDYKTECVQSGCQQMRKTTTETHGSGTFCLDRACFEQKQKEARKKQQSAHDDEDDAIIGQSGRDYIAPMVGADNTVNLDELTDVDYQPLDRVYFNTAACHGCEHFHTAVYTDEVGDDKVTERVPACFHPSLDCYRKKQQAAIKEREQWHNLEDHIERWLRRALTERLADDLHAQLAILGAIVLWVQEMEYDLEEDIYEAANTAGIKDIGDLLAHGLPTYAAYLYGPALEHMPLEYLQPIARHAGLDIADYRIDAEYLEDLDLAGLSKLVDANVSRFGEDEMRVKQTASLLTEDELRKLIQKRADKLAVPDNIQACWARLQEGKA